MKNHKPLIIAAILASIVFAGCSKPATTSLKTTDLGVVEVSDGETNRIDLGGGRICYIKAVTGKSFIPPENNNKVLLLITIEETKANGVTRSLPTVTLMPSYVGQTVGFSEEGIGISLTPHVKP